LRTLAQSYCRSRDVLGDIFYFTAIVPWSEEKAERHKVFIRAQEFYGVTPIYGQFRAVERRCRVCGQSYSTYEEKETDVNIAIKLYEEACAGTYDVAMILSGDSDLAPVVRAIKNKFPSKRIRVLIPPRGKADILKREAHEYSKIYNKHLKAHRLPDAITFADGSMVHCPASWMP